jgi:ubiquinol-cytochrome c reductase cytochrome b subunit
MLLPAIVAPGIIVLGFTLWPFIEARLTHDRSEHQLLQWPWQAPVRTAIGAAILAMLIILTVSGGNDVLAVFLHVNVDDVTNATRILVVVVPIVVGLVTYRLMVERRDRDLAERSPIDRLRAAGEPLPEAGER